EGVDHRALVAPDLGESRVDLEREVDVPEGAGGLERADGLLDDGPEDVVGELVDAAPALHAPPVEQSIDEALEGSAVLVEVLDTAVLGARIAAAQDERLGEHPDRGERGA